MFPGAIDCAPTRDCAYRIVVGVELRVSHRRIGLIAAMRYAYGLRRYLFVIQTVVGVY